MAMFKAGHLQSTFFNFLAWLLMSFYCMCICSDARKTIFAVSLAEWKLVLNSVGNSNCYSKHPTHTLALALNMNFIEFFSWKLFYYLNVILNLKLNSEVNKFSLVDLAVCFITSIVHLEIPPEKGFCKLNAV